MSAHRAKANAQTRGSASTTRGLPEVAPNAGGREWRTLGGIEKSASSSKEKVEGIEHQGETWSFSGQMANDDKCD
eukprot:7206178-Alexandrium_andersonii.AAC.1